VAVLPTWVPPAYPPTPLTPPPSVDEAEWLDVEVEGEGDHVLVSPTSRLERVVLWWVWIGNLGDGEARVGLKWHAEPNTWWNTTIPYMGHVCVQPPKYKAGPDGQALVLRVVGAGVRLSVSLLVQVRSVA